jgi:peptidoglycan/xylan/chitin deacetylase (PgdA/CDA1 family)
MMSAMGIRLRTFLFLVSLLIGAGAAAEQGRQVAITIDDLPRGDDGGLYDPAGMRAMTEKLLQPIRKHKIPVMGFVNAGRREGDPKELREILDLWLDAGAELGNHSYSHPDINNIPLSEYVADIVKGEPAIRDALTARGRKLEFYRHPFLHTGPTADVKQGLQAFLDQQGYRVAPVTLDNADYEFAMLYPKPEFRDQVRREYVPYMESVVNFFEQRSVEVVGYEIPQILLIHANQLNADLMPELLDMFRRRGYTFVTLAQALKDPAYNFPETYVGRGGFSWIHRWSKSKGMAAKGEPDPAEWVQKAIASAR